MKLYCFLFLTYEILIISDILIKEIYLFTTLNIPHSNYPDVL